MIMPVVYTEPRVQDPTTPKWLERRECRKCGDPATVRVQRYNFPQLVNHRSPREWQWVRLEHESKCAFCYL